MNLYRELQKSMHEKRYEPVKRNKDGWRYVGHRFPIKGGISLRDVMIAESMRHNAFLKKLMRDAA